MKFVSENAQTAEKLKAPIYIYSHIYIFSTVLMEIQQQQMTPTIISDEQQERSKKECLCERRHRKGIRR